MAPRHGGALPRDAASAEGRHGRRAVREQSRAGALSLTAAPARPPLRRLLLPGLAALVAFGILVGLGTWQLRRKAWKEDLIARIEARAAAEPVPLERALAAPPADGIEGQGYRRVRAEGRFRHDLEARVGATFSAPGANPVLGYDLLTPLALRDGRLIVVNRGFVPAELAASPGVARPEGEVSVTGLLREPEARGAFTPADDPARGLFFAPDPATIARAKSYAADLASPLLLDAERAGDGLPRAGRSRLVLPNDHLQYALTWFGLAAGLAGVFGAYAARLAGLRKSAGERTSPSP